MHFCLWNQMEPVWFIRIFVTTALYISTVIWLGTVYHKKLAVIKRVMGNKT